MSAAEATSAAKADGILSRRNHMTKEALTQLGCADSQITLVAGAGVSRSAGLPNWDELVRSLLRAVISRGTAVEGASAERRVSDFLDLLGPISAAEWVTNQLTEDEFVKLLQRALYDPPPTNPGILAAAVASIATGEGVVTFTTNFDDLVEQVYPQVDEDIRLRSSIRRPAGPLEPLWVDHLIEVPQFLYELGQMRASGVNLGKVADYLHKDFFGPRVRRWRQHLLFAWGAGQDGVPSDSPADLRISEEHLRGFQEELSRHLRIEMLALSELKEVGHLVRSKKEHLALQLWVYSPRSRTSAEDHAASLELWGTTVAVYLDPWGLTAVSLGEGSPQALAFCTGAIVNSAVIGGPSISSSGSVISTIQPCHLRRNCVIF